ncbi:MAG TPA: hypothetical protein VFT59_00390 [Candidatus Saccharimonadales bacterium]|nr:hypothetical protein [Candidatus Saccharimonadales bacterium]
MPKPHYEAFKYSSSYDPEAITTAATMDVDDGTRRRFYAATGAGDRSDQQLAVYLTIADSANRERAPVVRMTAFSDDNGRPEGGYFDAFLSHALKRPVLAPNAPGIDFSKWRDPKKNHAHKMTPDQHEELVKKGSFKRTGAAIMRALMAASNHFELNPDYLLTATSMGVALSGGVIREGLDKGVKFEGITLGEPVNIVERNLGRLAIQFATQFAPANNYLKQNPSEIPGESQRHWMKRLVEAREANHAYAHALGRASLLLDLGNVSDIADNQIPVLLGRGTASTLAPERAFADIANTFSNARIDPVIEMNHGHGHSYTLAVESVVKSARAIAA